MAGHALLVDAPALPVYDFGEGHPFAPFRLVPLFDLLDRQELVRSAERVVPPPATEAELFEVHDPEYVRLLARLADPDDHEALRIAGRFGLGPGDNPIRPGQHAAAAAAAGGTIGCVRAVLRGEAAAAFNPAGGLHHAMPGRASGFCLYNDLALGIAAARREGLRRIAYVDFDVHHGDGVEACFADDPDVLTISFHETPERRWPGTGRLSDRGRGTGLGSVIDLPFASGTGDASWQAAVEAVLRPALARFGPELLITQHGCDTHHEDPLADLSLTTASFRFAANLARELSEQHCAGRWVATGGGGYRPFTVLPRAFALVWAAVSGRDLPRRLDAGWREHWSMLLAEPDGAAAPASPPWHGARPASAPGVGEDLPREFIDPPVDDPRTAAAARDNARSLASLLALHDL